MNSKKIKNRYDNSSTTNLKQNFKGQTPLKISDNENQKTSYSKNNSNINSTSNNNNNISTNKNKNNKSNQKLNRANSSINNSKIIITNSNTSLCNNAPKNKHSTASMKLEKIISPSNKNNKKNNSNNKNYKHINKELKNYKYIFGTYDKDDKDDKDIKKNSFLYLKTEETYNHHSSKKKTAQKQKILDGNINSFKNISPVNIKKYNSNYNNNNNNSNNINIVNNKNFLEVKTIIKIQDNKKALKRTFSGCENKRKDSMNNKKNSYNNLGTFLCVNDEKNNKKLSSYTVLEKEEKMEDLNNFSKSAKKCDLKNSLGKNMKNQKIIKYNNNQINRYRGKSPISPINEISNQTDIKVKENTFFNNNNNINVYNIIHEINSNNMMIHTKQNIKINNIKKAKIKYKQKYKIIKVKSNYSSNKLKNVETQKYLSNNKNNSNNNNNNNNYNNNNKFHHKIIQKVSNYNQTEIKIPIIDNKINDKIINKKKSDNNINSTRKKVISIFEQSNRESYFINKDKKSPNHLQIQKMNLLNNKNEKEQKYNIKTQKKNYIKKINHISKNHKHKNNSKDSTQQRLSSVKGHINNHFNRFSHKNYHKFSCNSESKKNRNSNNGNFSSQNDINGYSTLSSRIKSLSFQNNKVTNYTVIKYPINERKDEIIDSKNDNIMTEENKNDIKINVNNCTIIINISSNWGNKKYLGINEIELFDKKNRKIKISDCIVIGGSNQNIKNIFNNKMHTMNENNMWITNIKNQKSSYDLKIKLVIYTQLPNNINNDINQRKTDNSFNEINYILIWNYNGIELNKGIKKIEVLDKYGNGYFVGIIPKGEHSITNYHPYKIKIHQNKNTNKLGSSGNIINKNLLHKTDTENSYKGNNGSSINHSIIQQNSKKNEADNDCLNKNLYYSVIRLSSKKEESYSEIKDIFPSNLNMNINQASSSSRSCKKKSKNEKKVNFKKKNDKNYKKISNSKNRRHIYEKMNKKKLNQSIKEKEKGKEKEGNLNSQNSDKNLIRSKSNKISQENLLGIPNIKQIIFEENDINNSNSINNENITDNNNNENNTLKYENYSENKISVLSLSEKQSMLLFTNNSSKNTLPYILFQKIRINILSNYGNKSFVGLAGLNLVDMYNQKINIETATSIGAFPKDLKTVYQNENDNRIFENIFNGINNTVDENYMWLTLINSDPCIEICFEKPMTLSKIEIWNYNEALNLDRGTKEIEIMFDSDENRKYYIMLWKGLGIDYYDYYQTIYVESLPDITKKIIQLKYNHLKFKYNTNYLPIGFVIKIIFIKNYGDKNIISLKKMEFFDENDKKLEKFTLINDNVNVNKNIKKEYFYFHDLYDFRKNEDSICNNLFFVCFDEIVQIKYIKIENTNDESLISTSTREIQIYFDDILIFEGILNQKGESILLFDKKDTNNFKNIININKIESNYIFKESINDKCCILTNLNT